MELNELIKSTADLAHLKYNDEELVEFETQFEKILGYVSTIEKLDLTGIEPLSHVITTENVFRQDIAKESLSQKDALSNAPKKNDNFFKVPKVIE